MRCAIKQTKTAIVGRNLFVGRVATNAGRDFCVDRKNVLLCLENLVSAMSYHTRFVRCDIPPVRIRNNRERD